MGFKQMLEGCQIAQEIKSLQKEVLKSMRANKKISCIMLACIKWKGLTLNMDILYISVIADFNKATVKI